MQSKIEEKITKAYQDLPREEARRYIGASSVGNECEAYLALSMRGFPDNEVDSRLKRIFRDGHTLERSILRDLAMAGFTVLDTDHLTGKQFEYLSHGGHVMGHGDGIILDFDGEESILLEAKSMNDNKFNAFKSKGVKSSHPLYYAQVQFMMGLSGMKRTALVAYNKNNSDYHSEIVEYDMFFYSSLVAKVDRVIAGNAERIARERTDWRCKSCFKHDSCWQKNDVEPECYKCTYAQPSDNRKWVCTYEGRNTLCGSPCENFKRYIPIEKK